MCWIDRWLQGINNWAAHAFSRDWLIDWTLFLNGEDISTKANSRICRCYSTTNNQDIHSQISWQKAIDKYSINNNNNNNNTYKTRQWLQRKWKK